jgi:UDP-N-acetylglucosamine 4,6-dehydratase
MSLDVFRGKTIAITGGTGSFGNFLVNKLLNTEVSRILIFSRDEEKQLDMSRRNPDPRLTFIIGDVRDRERAVECLRADFVYHAAALKIIPTCEENPGEAYKTNLLGTLNVKEACATNNVKKAIFVSTDKAVKPVNAYGMTKALAEKLWLAPSLLKGPIFACVRYGNVVGSRGSIVPFFTQLVKERKPIPITDTGMTRFWVTLGQAIQLVVAATQNTRAGGTYVPKNPACKVTDLVAALAGESYPVTVVGIRPGEKIAEILISEEEMHRTEELDDHFVIHPHGSFSNSHLKEEFSSATAKPLDVPAIRALLKQAHLNIA